MYLSRKARMRCALGALSLTFLLSACTDGNGGKDTPDVTSVPSSAPQTAATTAPASTQPPVLYVPDDGVDYAAGHSVLTPAPLTYYDVVYTDTDEAHMREVEKDGVKYTLSIPSFNALSDEAVNQTVDTRIRTEAEALATTDIGDQRGQTQLAGKIPQRGDVYVSYSEGGFFNNVLSVQISRWLDYGDDGYYTGRRFINLDMNTGEDIPLSAVFTDGFDYESAINTYLQTYIAKYNLADDSEYHYDSSFLLISPFQGIRKNQPFYVGGAGLYIVLDYENREFVFDYGTTAEVLIPYTAFDGHVAIFERYASDKPLSDLAYNRFLLGEEYLTALPLDAQKEGRYNYSGAQIDSSVLPADAGRALSDFVIASYPSLPAFETMADAHASKSKDETPSMWSSATVYRYGSYYTTEVSVSMYGFEPEKMNGYNMYAYTYNAAAGREAVLADYFTAAADAPTLLFPLVRNAMADNYTDYTLNPDLTFSRGDLRGTLVFHPTQGGLMGYTIWDGERPEDEGDYGPLQVYIRYADIGDQNLTLFGHK